MKDEIMAAKTPLLPDFFFNPAVKTTLKKMESEILSIKDQIQYIEFKTLFTTQQEREIKLNAIYKKVNCIGWLMLKRDFKVDIFDDFFDYCFDERRIPYIYSHETWAWRACLGYQEDKHDLEVTPHLLPVEFYSMGFMDNGGTMCTSPTLIDLMSRTLYAVRERIINV